MNTERQREYEAEIGGAVYGMDRIEAGEIVQNLFDRPGVGNTACAQLTLRFRPGTAPPRMGQVILRARDRGAAAWETLGIFWIDQRREVAGGMALTCYDVMLKSEAPWVPAPELEFPMSMAAAAGAIAAAMDTSLDPRCVFQPSYTVDYPTNDYTMRQVLGFIAGAHGGNWIVTAAGQLLLVPLFGSMPPETHYLIEEEEGGAITFGGIRILI